jgi:hypothetical protein
MSSLDSLITSDLAALGDDSRRNLVGLDDALRTTNMYRDDRPGAEARRDALADERRRELVMMPLQLSHIFAHRVARAAAGATAIVCTLAIVAMLSDPLLLSFAVYFVPSMTSYGNLESLGLILALVVLGAYVLAMWFAQGWFARRMRDAIRTGDDPYRDLDALARGPAEVAQQALRRVDGLALGLTFAGATALAVTLGYIFVIVDTFAGYPYSWSYRGIMHAAALEKNLGMLIAALVAVGVAAFVIARASRLSESKLLARLGHWSTLAIAFAIGLATAYVGLHTLIAIRIRESLPSDDLRFLLALGTTVAIGLAAAWCLLWLRRREQRKSGD